MENISTINFKLNSQNKNQFEKVCETLGLSVSAALNIFINKTIHDQGIPFPVTVPKDVLVEKSKLSDTLKALRELKGIFSDQAKKMGIKTQDDVNKFLRDFRNGK